MRKHRLTINELRLISLFFLLTFLIINHSSLIINPALAKDASPAASLTPIQKKLQDLKQEIASKAAQIKSEISQKISNKAYIGVIDQVADVSQQEQTFKQSGTASPSATTNSKIITITTPKGNRTIVTNDYTAFQDTTNSKKAATVKNFNKGDFIAALGEVDDNRVLTAKKIIKTKPPQVTNTAAFWGQIQSVSPSTISVINRDNKKLTLGISLDTNFRVASDEATLKEVIPGNFLVSIGAGLQNNRSVSDFVYLINPNGELKITPVASASATPSASPKPSASAIPKKK